LYIGELFRWHNSDPSSIAAALGAVTTEARTGGKAGGAGSQEGKGLQRGRSSNALLALKSQSFPDNVMADFRPG
jgi:hypothetical protein